MSQPAGSDFNAHTCLACSNQHVRKVSWNCTIDLKICFCHIPHQRSYCSRGHGHNELQSPIKWWRSRVISTYLTKALRCRPVLDESCLKRTYIERLRKSFGQTIGSFWPLKNCRATETLSSRSIPQHPKVRQQHTGVQSIKNQNRQSQATKIAAKS